MNDDHPINDNGDELDPSALEAALPDDEADPDVDSLDAAIEKELDEDEEEDELEDEDEDDLIEPEELEGDAF